MFIGRLHEIDTIRAQLALGNDAEEHRVTIALHGLFGAGKTTLLRRLQQIIREEELADAMTRTGEDISVASLPEFVFQLASGFESLDPSVARFTIDETEARRRRYLQISGRLGADTMPLLRELQANWRSARAQTVDGKGRNLEGELLELEIAIKNQFNNPDDQRLTLDTANVMTESLIIDLMNTFYPLSPAMPTLSAYLERELSPRKIVILIDTYEKITPTVNPWLLESFLPYVFQKRFGDFQCYRTDMLPLGTFVRDFLDVRLVIAGRERLTLTDYERRWDRYRDAMIELPIGTFTPEELDEYLLANGIDPGRHAETVRELTGGLPYLVALWVDAKKSDSSGAEGTFISSLAEQRIFWYKTPQQRDWIRAAAFLDWFDIDALRCFPGIEDHASEAFDYLRSSSEVARASVDNPGKFELHPIIRQALRESMFQESSQLAVECREAAEAFYDATDIFERFHPDERALLRRLTYLVRFDDYALVKFFGGEAQSVRDLVSNAGDLFAQEGSTMTWKGDVIAKLRRYNRFAERKTYSRMVEQARKLWQLRSRSLQDELQACRAAIADSERRLRHLRSEHLAVEQSHASTRRSAQSLQTEVQMSKFESSRGIRHREDLVSRISFVAALACFSLLFFAEGIGGSEATVQLVETISLVFGLLFIALFALTFARSLQMRKRGDLERQRREVLSVAEDKLLERQLAISRLNAEAETAEKEITSIGQEMERLNREIDQREGLLAQPYV